MRHGRRHSLLLPLAATIVPLALPLLPVCAQAYGPPITVDDGNYQSLTRAGVISGSWESVAADTPAVTINTTKPVIIQNSRLRGRGILISALPWQSDLTVRNSTGYGVNPNVRGQAVGRFVSIGYRGRLVVEHCDLENTGGIMTQAPPRSAPAGTARIRFNRVHNVDGRLSDGRGGWLDDSHNGGHTTAQFVAVDHAHLLSGEIAWNEVVNDPDSSRVEDNINVFGGGGTPHSPLAIHDNYIQGAYAGNPASGYYGGGGIITDGGSDDGAGPTEATTYVHVFNNQVVSTENYGIAVAAGHDNEIDHNRVVSSGGLADGRRFAPQTLPASGVGVYVVNIDSSRAFARNKAHDNVVGLMRPTGQRYDYNLRDADGAVRNASLTRDPAAAVTLGMEAAEYGRWRKKLAAHDVLVGLVAGPT